MKKNIATGTLTLNVTRNDTGMEEDELYAIAARENPKRGYLIVSKLIGRHIPTIPCVMRDTMKRMADLLDASVPGPVLVIGMAETAVGLGQGVHEAFRHRTGRDDIWFIQSTRQTHPDMAVWTTFEEGHSHATSHLIHVPDKIDIISGAKTLIIVDDECSTGKTFVETERAMRNVLPRLERVVDLVITDWSVDQTRDRRSLVAGNIMWKGDASGGNIPGMGANNHGETTPGDAPGRTGYRQYRRELGLVPNIAPGQRVTVLCDGENSYDALLVAEALEQAGGLTAVQSVTRSPAYTCDVLKTRDVFQDGHGSGATCYSYNLMGHRPDAIVVVVERRCGQRERVVEATGLPAEAVHQLVIPAADKGYGKGRSRSSSGREKP